MENKSIVVSSINYSSSDMDLFAVNELEKVKYFGLMVFLVVIMVFGIMGNVLVIVIYKTKFKRSSARVYILSLAMADLSVCIVGIPYHVLDLEFAVSYTHTNVCKILSFFIGACTLSSIFILLVVGLDRYLRVCRSLKKQIVDFGDHKSCIIAVILAFILNIPYGILYGQSSVYISTYNITGVECFISDANAGSIFATGFLGFNLLLFLVSVVFLVIIYGLIGRKIYKHDHMNDQIGLKKRGIQCLCCTRIQADNPEDSDDDVRNDETLENDVNNTHANNAVQMSKLLQESGDAKHNNTNTIDEHQDIPLREKKKTTFANIKLQTPKKIHKVSSATIIRHSGPGARHKEKNTTKITMMMFTITIVFIVTYLPHIIVVILDNIDDEFWTGLSDFESVLYDLLLRLYLVNNVTNPIIYGFWDKKFRRELFRLVRRVLCCWKDGGQGTAVSLSSTMKHTKTWH